MKNKITYFENLRVIATIGVIITHAIFPIMVIAPHTGITPSWWFGNILQSALRFVVPIMIMQSGALLLNPSKTETMEEFFQKRFSKVLLPFITWNIIYSIVVAISSKKYITGVFLSSFNGPIFYHLWFVYALVGLYLITPFLRILIKSCPKKMLEYTLLLCFFITAINPLFKRFFGHSLDIRIDYLYGYIGYFLLGYYVYTFEIKKFTKLVIYGLGIFGFFAMLYLTYYLTMLNGTKQGIQTDYYFHEYLSIFVILISTAVFVFAKTTKWFSKLEIPYCNSLNLARICFGVYLSQSLVLSILRFQFGIYGSVASLVWGTILSSGITLLICFGLFIILDLLTRFKLINKLSKLIY